MYILYIYKYVNKQYCLNTHTSYYTPDNIYLHLYIHVNTLKIIHMYRRPIQ